MHPRHLALLLLAGCAAAPVRPGFVAVYHWRVKAGCEREVQSAWRAEALRYRDHYGSCGARLHRDDDGTFVALAFWRTREAWAQAPRPIDAPEAEAVLDRCLEAKVAELHLELLEDTADLTCAR